MRLVDHTHKYQNIDPQTKYQNIDPQTPKKKKKNFDAMKIKL